MSRATEEELYTDMSRCLPANALTREPKRGCWRLMEYELANGTAGTMALAVPGEGAEEITLPLNVKGTYKIYIGINYTKNPCSQWSGSAYLASRRVCTGRGPTASTSGTLRSGIRE